MTQHRKYQYERISFVKKHGEQPILKSADALAEYLWFSPKKVRQEIKTGAAQMVKDSFKLLRMAQFSRRNPSQEQQDLWFLANRMKRGSGSFDLINKPAAYMHPLQRLKIGDETVGYTTGAKRIKGGIIQVHYSSDIESLQLVRIEIKNISSVFDQSLGANTWRAVYHVKKID